MTEYKRIINTSIEEMATRMVELAKGLCKAYVFCSDCPFYCVRQYTWCNKSGFIDYLESEVEE